MKCSPKTVPAISKAAVFDTLRYKLTDSLLRCEGLWPSSYSRRWASLETIAGNDRSKRSIMSLPEGVAGSKPAGNLFLITSLLLKTFSRDAVDSLDAKEL